jgi:putative tricarboxylic transport membrane protein
MTDKLKTYASCVLAAFAMQTAPAAQAQSWKPDKPIEMLVGSGAGGSADILARHVQRIIQEHKLLPAPFNVINKPGGNQTLLRTYLNQHAGDAHYFDLGNPTLVVNHILGITPQHYSDFTPVALLMNEYAVFTVKADSPVKNVRDVIEILRKNPESWSVGVSNLGGTNHLTYALLARAAGIDPKKLKVVVFKSNTEGMTAVVGGHLNMVSSAVSSAMTQVKQGNARIIALGAPKRMGGAMAGVPTLREQGVDIAASNWRGIVGAKGLSGAQIAYWEEVFAKVAATDDWKKILDAQFWDGNFLRSREFAKYIENDYHQTRAIMTDLGLAK